MITRLFIDGQPKLCTPVVHTATKKEVVALYPEEGLT
jgi:hypothetical protein